MTVAVLAAEPGVLSMYHSTFPFHLEGGGVLPNLTIAYRTWGELSPHGDNAIWICHALTGDSAADQWWDGIVGPGKVIDTTRFFVVCAAMIGSCYGSTGPRSIDPLTGDPYGMSFPLVTIRDMVRAHIELRKELGIDRIRAVVGGSMGGQQALEWAVMEPDAIAAAVPIATNARHSPWGIAFNASQRMSLEADPTFFENLPDAGARGLAAARAIGMLSYRTHAMYNGRQRESDDVIAGFRAESYQRYQGQKLVERFHAHAYWTLTRAMDSHDVGRGRGGTGAALRAIKAEMLVIGIDTDLLFPEEEQHFIVDMVPKATYRRLRSNAGHDAFLLDQDRLALLLQSSPIFS